MKKENNQKAKLFVRILAIVLTVLMVVSVAFYTFYMIAVELRNNKENNDQKTAAIVELLPDRI